MRGANDDVLDAASEARFKEGLAFAKQGKYEQARASFLQSLVLSPGSPNVLLNLAISEHGAGHPVEALGHLKMYLASPKVDAKKAQEVKQTLYDELWRATGHLKIQADRGDSLVLDGEVKLGNAPLADVVDVSVGKHRVASGPRTVDVTVSAGETKDVVLVAERPSAPVLIATPGVVPGHTEEPPPETTQSSPARWIVPVGLGVAAAGALVMGIGFGAGNRNAVDKAEQLRTGAGGRPCADQASAVCANYNDELSTGRTDKTLSYVGYIGAGAFAAAAIAAIVFWPRDAAKTTGHTRIRQQRRPPHEFTHVQRSRRGRHWRRERDWCNWRVRACGGLGRCQRRLSGRRRRQRRRRWFWRRRSGRCLGGHRPQGHRTDQRRLHTDARHQRWEGHRRHRGHERRARRPTGADAADPMRPSAYAALVAFTLTPACSDEAVAPAYIVDAGSDGGVIDAGSDVVQPPDGCDPAADPKDAPKCVVSEFAVFVDATGGVDANAGTKESPVKSITAALGKLGGKNRVPSRRRSSSLLWRRARHPRGSSLKSLPPLSSRPRRPPILASFEPPMAMSAA